MTITRSGIVGLVFAVFVAATCSCSQVAAPTRAKSTPASDAKPNTDEFAVNSIALKLPLANPKIIVSKSRRRLMLYSNTKLVRLYRVGLVTDTVNDKIKEGDRRTPEGEVYIF